MAADEPRVSVHGIPQSQYDPSSPSQQAPMGTPGTGNAPTGFWQHVEAHWPIWALGLGVLTIVVIIWVGRSGNNSSAVTAGGTGTGTGNSDPSTLYGSQLDADYQQLQQSMETNSALLQQILTASKTPGPTGPAGPAGAPGPAGTPGATGSTGPAGSNPFAGQMYSVLPGNTLEGIALSHGFVDLQGKAAWQQLYETASNAQVISSTAKSHGITAHFENYVYPGEKITL